MDDFRGSCGLEGLKSENVEKLLGFQSFLEAGGDQLEAWSRSAGGLASRPGGILGSLWGYFALTLDDFRGSCGLEGLKSENVETLLVFQSFLEAGGDQLEA